MPINPSIITSGNQMAPVQLPDVNAMMQTQTRGMEKMYGMERQRQADAAAAQEAAAADQEAATIKALLPAYTYGIQTGDIAGAGNLVPPEMRGQLQPFIDALAGQPPEAVKSALIGSLSASPAGQEALAAIQRAQTAQIQQGQLDVSRGRLAFETEQAAAETARKPEPSYKEVILDDGTLVLMDTKSGKIIQPTMTGPIDTAVPPQEGAPKPLKVKQKDAEGKPITEYQGKAVQHATSMAYADKITSDLEKEGVVTPDAVSNAILGVVRSVPLQAGANLANELEYGLNAVLPGLSPEEQRLARAQLAFITAVLRSESGAEIKASEFPAEYRKYFAVAGDEGNQKLLEEKKTQRRIRIASMREAAGEEGRKAIDRILSEQGVTETAGPTTAPVAPGATLEGFEYQGVRK